MSLAAPPSSRQVRTRAASFVLALLVPVLALADTTARPAPPGLELLQAAERALADTVRSAHASRGLDPQSPAQRPFWNALTAMEQRLGEVDAALRAPAPRRFQALSGGSRALAELRVVWSRTGVDDAAVATGIGTLAASYRLLRDGYGWESQRLRQGGALSDAERRQLQTLQRQQARLARRLQALAARARQERDRQQQEELASLLARANRIAAAPFTLAGYLESRLLGETLAGEWAAASHYVKPADRAAWQQAGEVVESLATDPAAGFVFAVDLGSGERWHYDESTEGGDEAAGTAAAPRGTAAGDGIETVVPEVLGFVAMDGATAAAEAGPETSTAVDGEAAVDDAEAGGSAEEQVALADSEPVQDPGEEADGDGPPAEQPAATPNATDESKTGVPPQGRPSPVSTPPQLAAPPAPAAQTPAAKATPARRPGQP
jgi:hypothetical protein